MDAPSYFEQAADHAIFRPAGVLKLVELVEMVSGVISFARDSGVSRLLVVPTAVSGFPPPKPTVRYRFVRDWARASEGKVRVAVVTSARMMDPDRFGVTVATNAGMDANVFEDEKKAVEWLAGCGGGVGANPLCRSAFRTWSRHKVAVLRAAQKC
ncbi:MAG: hypothetical protein NTY98_03885 [Verrucomicrobia bacterium]|nr:hypothetical protein [Verrucomicrobiota bacterium]